MTTQSEDSQDALESKVRDVVARGTDVQATVHQLTLDALSHQTQGIEAIGRIMRAVVQGTRDGVQEELQKTTIQAQAAQTHIKEAVSGLDAALAQFVEASRLAVEEAAGHAQKFSSQDLARTRADLENLEALFLETMKTSAAATRGMVAETLTDLVGHAKRTGTAVGEQVKATLEAFTRHMTETGKHQLEAGVQLAKATSDMMRKIAAGMLSGLAARVQPAAPTKPAAKTSRSKDN